MNPKVRAAAALTLVCAFAARSQGRVDIVQIWENFIASRVAASECGGIDKNSDQNFLVNLTSVTIRVTQAIEQRNPTVPNADLVGKINALSDGIHDKVDAEIKQNSCSSPRIQQLLSMYKLNAAITF